MIAHICREAGLNPGYLVGGAVNGWERSATAGNGRLLITEVDESDGTQAGFQADIAVVLNVDDDHCWSLGGVEKLEACFAEFGRRAELVVAWRTPTTERLFGDQRQVAFVDEALAVSEGAPPQPGPHNRANGAVAVAVAERLGVGRPAALAALRCFPGVSRRLSERYRSADGRLVIVEDYAHHPAELRATMAALREGYPRHRLLILFQPHRFERVKRYGAAFAELLSAADRAWVVAPFAAWRQDQELADPREIVRQMRPEAAAGYLANDPAAIAAAVVPEMLGGQAGVLAVIGAGDVGQALPALCRAMP
jgi:UDP-N-acetylmuramate--alanine ligase